MPLEGSCRRHAARLLVVRVNLLRRWGKVSVAPLFAGGVETEHDEEEYGEAP